MISQTGTTLSPATTTTTKLSSPTKHHHHHHHHQHISHSRKSTELLSPDRDNSAKLFQNHNRSCSEKEQKISSPPPKKRKRFDEIIIDGFAITAFKSWEDLQDELNECASDANNNNNNIINNNNNNTINTKNIESNNTSTTANKKSKHKISSSTSASSATTTASKESNASTNSKTFAKESSSKKLKHSAGHNSKDKRNKSGPDKSTLKKALEAKEKAEKRLSILQEKLKQEQSKNKRGNEIDRDESSPNPKTSVENKRDLHSRNRVDDITCSESKTPNESNPTEFGPTQHPAQQTPFPNYPPYQRHPQSQGQSAPFTGSGVSTAPPLTPPMIPPHLLHQPANPHAHAHAHLHAHPHPYPPPPYPPPPSASTMMSTLNSGAFPSPYSCPPSIYITDTISRQTSIIPNPSLGGPGLDTSSSAAAAAARFGHPSVMQSTINPYSPAIQQNPPTQPHHNAVYYPPFPAERSFIEFARSYTAPPRHHLGYPSLMGPFPSVPSPNSIIAPTNPYTSVPSSNSIIAPTNPYAGFHRWPRAALDQRSVGRYNSLYQSTTVLPDRTYSNYASTSRPAFPAGLFPPPF